MSAGVIALITGAFGGTRVQCSGPTAPMTTVTTVVVAYSRTDMFADIDTGATGLNYNSTTVPPPGCSPDDYDVTMCPMPDRFVNIVMLMTSILMVVMGACKIGQYIRSVCN